MLAGEHFGRYEISSKIGEGGMGEVYSARDAELGRSIAIKLLPAEFTDDAERKLRFRQEARVISSINHPNIITIYEIGENDRGTFLATELVEGVTLREMLRSEKPGLVRGLGIVEQTANALAAAHDAHIIHRDIKPDNIMVRRDSIVKVLDFGLAKPVFPIGPESQTSSSQTIPGTVMGSASYMSPEQARGVEVDARTDIWSLGVVLYEIFAGVPPFKGETAADTIAAVIYAEPEPLSQAAPGLPAELYRIVRKALQKEPEERYQDVKDLALDLHDLLREIEHANSGDGLAHRSSSPGFTESPTMIHRTVSANHPTENGIVMTTSHPAGVRAASHRRMALVGGVGALLLALLGLGGAKWLAADAPLAATAFGKPQISRLKTDGRVMLPAISPDGRYIAYVSGELGNRSLVVRQVATESMVTLVPPTNLNFSAVSFSPDGDYVYYCLTRSDYSVNTLFQVPTLGGPSKKLVEDVDSTVTFSPDGKRFAFVRHTSKESEDLIIVVDAATLEQSQLIGTKQTAFDFFSMRLSWSPNGESILLGAGKRQGGAAGEMSIVEVLLSDGSLRIVDGGTFYSVGNFVWFPDGLGFVFAARASQTAPVQIWKSSYPETEFHPVTNDLNDYAEVGLSDDGRTIATVKGDTSSSLWKIAAPGSEPVQLTQDDRYPSGTFGLAQMPDESLIYTRVDAKESEIWLTRPDGREARLIAGGPGSNVAPNLAPDGRSIVFSAITPAKTSVIWRTDAASGASRTRLTAESSEYSDYHPQFTPDGSSVIFQRQFVATDRSVLMKVPAAGGEAALFYQDPQRGVFAPRLSPDGRYIAFSTYDVTTFEKKLVIAVLEKGTIARIERELEYNLINQVAWSPDSRSLTILTSRGGIPNLWRQPLDGSEPRPITDFKTGRIFNFAWGTDKKSLLIARGNTTSDLLLIRDTGRETGGDAVTQLRSVRSARGSSL